MNVLCKKTPNHWGHTGKVLKYFFVRKSKELFSVSAGKVANNKLELWQRILVLGTIL